MTAPNTQGESDLRVGISNYVEVGTLLAVFCAALVYITQTKPRPVAAEQLLTPMFALVALTVIVWVCMVVVRNWTVLRGTTSAAYYVDYVSQPPPDWVERSARAFNNLMQVPTLFYVVSLLMLVTKRADTAQLVLAWLFVVVRALHVLIYIGWNYVPYRFASWSASCIVLGVLWFRFAT